SHPMWRGSLHGRSPSAPSRTRGAATWVVNARALRLIGGLALAACSAGDDVAPPAISAITPDRAASGIGVTVSGSHLCQNPPTNSDDSDPLACAHVGTVTFDVVPGL